MREEPPVCFADSPLLRKGAREGRAAEGVGPCGKMRNAE